MICLHNVADTQCGRAAFGMIHQVRLVISSNPDLTIFANDGWFLAAIKLLPDFYWVDRQTGWLKKHYCPAPLLY